MINPRVLMLSDVYFPRVNGVSTSIQTFRQDLAAADVSSWLVAPRYPAAWSDDPQTIRVSSAAVPLDPEDRAVSPRALLDACRALADRIDLIHIQTPFIAHWAGVKLSRELGVKAVETYHTYFEHYLYHYAPILPRSAMQWAARKLAQTQCNAVDLVIAPSEPMASVLRGYGVRTPIEIVGTGLDLARFEGGDGERFRREHGIPSDRPVLLYVGRVAFEKNIEFLIDMLPFVLAELPEVLLIIAGEGPALPALRRVVADRNLERHVTFVGYLDRDGPLLDCYRSANAFVFASSTETQGLVILEAMAVGTPVVSTAALGTSALLENQHTGAVIAPDRFTDFAAAVIRVLTDRSLQRKLGEAGRHYVRTRWSSRAMADRMIGLYRSLTGTRVQSSSAGRHCAVGASEAPAERGSL